MLSDTTMVTKGRGCWMGAIIKKVFGTLSYGWAVDNVGSGWKKIYIGWKIFYQRYVLSYVLIITEKIYQQSILYFIIFSGGAILPTSFRDLYYKAGSWWSERCQDKEQLGGLYSWVYLVFNCIESKNLKALVATEMQREYSILFLYPQQTVVLGDIDKLDIFELPLSILAALS